MFCIVHSIVLVFQADEDSVVGEEEAKSRTVNIRNRDDQATQTKGELVPLEEALSHLLKLKAEKRRINGF